MPRTLQYIIMFFVLVLLQMLLLSNLNLSIYLHPMIYLAFVVLLPMDMPAVWVLFAGLLMGAVTDVSSGTAGLNTAAILFTSFARPLYLRLAADKDEIREGGMPTSGRLGTGGFLKYVFVLSAIHCLIYFSLEAATWSYYYLTLIRVMVSAVVTTALIAVFQLFYIDR